MTVPVQNQQPRQLQNSQQPSSPAPPIQERPQGIANIPDGIGSAQNSPSHLPERGYVETFIAWVANWIRSIFKKIFCCFDEEPRSSSVPQEQQIQQPQISVPQLTARIQREVALLNALDSLSPIEKKRIYRRIGESAFSYGYPRQWFRSYEDTGRLEVEKNPMLLAQYIELNQ